MSIENPRPDFVERRKNISEVETARAIYSIVYSDHETLNDPAIVKDVDAVILELAESEAYDKTKTLEVLRGSIDQYRMVFEAAIKNKKPLFVADLSINAAEYGKAKTEYALTQFLIPAIEASLGALAISSAVKDSKSDKKTSRRSFLASAGKLLAGGYLMTPALAQVGLAACGPVPDERSFGRQATKHARSVTRAAHPEVRSTILDIRNDLMAQKAETIANILKKEITGRKPKLGFFVGAGHSGLEKSLQTSEAERVDALLSDLEEGVAKQNKIVRIDFKSNHLMESKVEVFSDPTLQL